MPATSLWQGLELGRKGTIAVNDNMESSIPMIYAGGDIVRGGATVILAMGDGQMCIRDRLSSVQSAKHWKNHSVSLPELPTRHSWRPSGRSTDWKLMYT